MRRNKTLTLTSTHTPHPHWATHLMLSNSYCADCPENVRSTINLYEFIFFWWTQQKIFLRMWVTKRFRVPTDSIVFFSILWKARGTSNSLVTTFLQNIFFYMSSEHTSLITYDGDAEQWHVEGKSWRHNSSDFKSRHFRRVEQNNTYLNWGVKNIFF